MPAVWDDTMTKQLLLAVVHLSPPSAPDWDKVAAIVGGSTNGNGCKQNYNKIKRNCKEEFDKLCGDSDNTAAAADGDTAAPKTPKKRATGKKAAGEKSSTKRKAKEVVSEDAADEDDEESPTKKVKEDPESFF